MLYTIFSFFVFVANQTITSIPPIIVKYSNCHQPVLPVSWSLLVATAILGSRNIRYMIRDKIWPVGSPILYTATVTRSAPNPMIKVNKKNHQYSLRLALPLKMTYLPMQVEIDSLKFIFLPQK